MKVNGLVLAANKIGFWGRKHSPELLLAGAIITAAGAIGTAIYSTTKVGKVLKPYGEKITDIRNNLSETTDTEAAKNLKKELGLAYLKAGVKTAELYLPSILLFSASCSCSLGSHRIQKNRNLALAAAYATLEKGYDSYRKRVQEKLGEEAEEKIYKDIRKETVEVIDPKTGKTKTVTKEVPHLNTDEAFNVIYSAGNAGWERDAQTNFSFLMNQQAYLNERLRRFGYVFLSDVYDILGYDVGMIGKEKMRASRILGWVYDPTDETRDNYISFGLTQPGTDIPLPKIATQIEMNEPDFWLNLNVDGDILNGKIKFSNYAKR